MKHLPVVTLLLLASLAHAAARPLRSSEQAVVNFGFATQLGSGIYSVAGRTLQVYRLPFGYTPPQPDDSPLQVRLTAPLTIGFLDFAPRDVIDTGLPQNLDTYSLVPGVELDYAVATDWHLQAFAEAGVARDRNADVDQRVYGAGLRSLYDFGAGPANWQLYGEAVHVLVEQVALDGRDDFTRLRLGLTTRRPFASDGPARRPDWLGYAFTEAFTDAPAGPAGDGQHGSGLQYEVGFTLGATQTLRVWRIPLPRVGFGYRFGDGVSIYRIVFGSPY